MRGRTHRTQTAIRFPPDPHLARVDGIARDRVLPEGSQEAFLSAPKEKTLAEDLTLTFDSTDGDLFRRIWRMTWPMVVYNLLEMTVGLVDFLMVRPLGSPATAAIGLSRQVTFIIEVAVLAISTGAITYNRVPRRAVDSLSIISSAVCVPIATSQSGQNGRPNRANSTRR